MGHNNLSKHKLKHCQIDEIRTGRVHTFVLPHSAIGVVVICPIAKQLNTLNYNPNHTPEENGTPRDWHIVGGTAIALREIVGVLWQCKASGLSCMPQIDSSY